MESTYTSDFLYHFVGNNNPLDHQKNFDVLVKILNDECISYPPHDTSCSTTKILIDLDKSILDAELVNPGLTCYADIPENCLSIHMSKYGEFGIAFSRNFLIKSGARPVTYWLLFENDDIFPNGGRGLIKHIQQCYEKFFRYSQKLLYGTRMANLK